ncbi:putative Survival motor neuron-like protein [Blumeria hordei DH14]|uniref:Putative Survival motor neuron-like protein n=1 Tax=Blumeria graminis f. sp. hordei (strain DH14) TaxID=546991 RepID=A0A078N0K8_BLUG1|nr:putative Survival motor neuron-like protein [Blumeria hordei DH14]
MSDGISQAEIWDDSALIESWDQALEEYKKYHSLRARGENVEDILNSAEDSTVDPPRESNSAIKNDDFTPEISGTQATGHHLPVEQHNTHKQQYSTDTQANTNIDLTPHPKASNKITHGPELPRMLVGQVHDERLKNLLMSWYYAGYYTGLYEGQHEFKAAEQ